jgi:transaldolase
MNSLKQLQDCGQSIWLDYIRRDLITSGEFQRLVEEDGVHGVTSNPTIFDKAIAAGTAYDDALRLLLLTDPDRDAQTLFESLEIEDLQMAADILRSVYDQTEGADGFVSIEVSPRLAYDSAASIAEAQRLWKAVNRPNLMVKIPSTVAGIQAVEVLIADGININITLMFSLAHYEAVAQAYLRGLKRNAKPHQVSSVASFFVSRVDTEVDRALQTIGTPEALSLRGEIAIANARVVYRRFREIFLGTSFEEFRSRGARLQRPLWGKHRDQEPGFLGCFIRRGIDRTTHHQHHSTRDPECIPRSRPGAANARSGRARCRTGAGSVGQAGYRPWGNHRKPPGRWHHCLHAFFGRTAVVVERETESAA